MRGLHAGSSWTHLILGFAVAGVGSGLVNPPLASTAVGVVAPKDAGMASASTPHSGKSASPPPSPRWEHLRHHLHQVSPSTWVRYATTINELLLIAALTAITAGILALMLIRTKDFATHPTPPGKAPTTPPRHSPPSRSRRLHTRPRNEHLETPHSHWPHTQQDGRSIRQAEPLRPKRHRSAASLRALGCGIWRLRRGFTVAYRASSV